MPKSRFAGRILIVPMIACCAMLLSLALVSGQTPATSDEPWVNAPLSADPQAVLKAAASVEAKPGEDAVVLFEEYRFEFEADGRKTRTWRMVYRVASEAGAQNWASIQNDWQPWNQDRPEIRARVITRDGAVHNLDPKTLTEAGVGEEDKNVYSDRRMLKGPLPAVAIGSVVEAETVLRERAPFFDQGTTNRVEFGGRESFRHTRLVIDAPATLPLQYKIQLMPDVQAQRSESDGRIRLTFERGVMPAWRMPEPYSTPDQPRYPGVWFSTGKSWQAVAERYAQMVDEQIRAADREAMIGKALEGARGREDIIWRLMRRLHEQVRYTGIEFDEASLVPRTPAETLQRKFGDCKDKSAMLVAMLRAAGIEAHVAVLRTSPQTNPDPTLPGMGEFDHAIVYVPGKPDYWIDATDEYSRLDALADSDQDRLALVAAPGTQELKRTSSASSSQNRIVETREFFLAPMGSARVTETTEVFGGKESDYRYGYAVRDPKEINETLQKYFDEAYLSKAPVKYEHTAPKDYSQPFRLRIETPKATRGTTELKDAAVAIMPAGLFEQLPPEFRDENAGLASEPEETAEPPNANQKKERKRSGPLFLPAPSTVEWNYRITPPPGFQVRSLPESGTEKFGSAIYSKEFKQGEGGVVTGVLRFDTGKREMSAEEAEALRQAVLKIRRAEALMVVFAYKGFDLLEAGKIREALAEFRSVASKEPNVAAHHVRTAQGLLAAGLGEAAREEARRATVAEPQSSLAWQTLGWILQHDVLGRRFKKGFDWDGAIAAHRKAVELEADNVESRGDLAILLEHNAEGERYAKGAKLDEAILEYLKIKEKMKGTGLAANLPIVYLRAGKFKELREEAKALPPGSGQRDSLLLIATAALEGSAVAIQQANKEISSDDARRKAMSGAGATLVQLRFYPQGADLLAAGARGAANATATLGQAEMYRKAIRYEDLKLSPSDPRDAVKQMFALIFAPERPKKEDLMAISSKAAADELSKEDERDSVGELTGARIVLARSGVPLAVGRDLIVANIQFSAEGIEGGDYRVRTEAPGSAPMTFLVVRENGVYRILDEAKSATSVGLEVLWRVDRGDLPGARRLLDWVREEMQLTGGDDPYAGKPFPRLWEKGREADSDAIRAAGASLLVTTPNANLAVPILRGALEKALDNSAARVGLQLALAAAYVKLSDFNSVLPIAEELLRAYPDSEIAFMMVIEAQNSLKHWDQAEAVAQARLKRRENDATALRALARIEEFRGQFAESIEHLRRLAALGKATASDYNGMAWGALFIEPMPQQAVEDAQRAAQLSQNNNAAIVHTLSAVWAEAGKTNEAREAMLQAIELYNLEEPNAAIWYLYGRLAELWGEKQTAVAAYKRMEKPKNIERQPTATYRLAQRNLKRM
ncbi:MAG: DUF3857 domain-containing protein [Acidobacteria bacterium]|nr:DUF3857 domain-containing protein [Acidobacteriota bacterium]MCL5288908.1 DUF3857 domain-containing protein [Acidobacteriota bacterium]